MIKRILKKLESALEAHGFKLMHQFKSITDYPKAELQKVTILNTSVFIPSNAEEYLAEIYGVNWRIPYPNYDWHNGPKNNCTVSNAYGIMENTIQITREVLRNNFSIMRPSFKEAA